MSPWQPAQAMGISCVSSPWIVQHSRWVVCGFSPEQCWPGDGDNIHMSMQLAAKSRLHSWQGVSWRRKNGWLDTWGCACYFVPEPDFLFYLLLNSECGPTWLREWTQCCQRTYLLVGREYRGKGLALHTADLNLIPGIPYSFLNTQEWLANSEHSYV